MKNKKPNFFIIGFPRCGTTSLYNYFKQHPDIFVTSDKELHYFANGLMHELFDGSATKRNKFILSEQRFLDYYSDVSGEKIIVNVAPSLILSKKAAEKIYNFNKEAKILVMLRNPLKRSTLHSECLLQ